MIAIKIYGPNTKGIPEEWPKEVITNQITLPTGYDLLLSEPDFEQYKQDRQALYDAYLVVNEERRIKSNIIQNAQSEKQQFTRIKLEKQVETELQALTDDAEILENQAGYPLWSSFSDQHPFEPNDKVQDFEGNELKMFRIITPHSKQSDRVPITVPALWTKIEFSGGVEVWAQPTGGDGKYPYLDPSTNQPYRVTHNGLIWENNHRNESNHSDPDTLNVWEPGVFGWTQVT